VVKRRRTDVILRRPGPGSFDRFHANPFCLVSVVCPTALLPVWKPLVPPVAFRGVVGLYARRD
jgi:hypothetical protein